MIRLLRVEGARLLARRAVLLLLAAAVVIPTLMGAVLAWEHRPYSDAEIVRAEARAEAERDARWVKRELRECIAEPAEWLYDRDDVDDVEAACRAMVEPDADWYLWRSPLDIAEHLRWDTGFALTMIVMALLMLAGTTFIGHDWATGSMTNQLLFEPRRGRVWVAKALAVAILTAVTAAVVHTAYWWGLWAVARAYEHEQQSGVMTTAMAQSGRAVLLTTAAAVGAYAVTMFFRSTVGTLGIMAAVAIAGGIVLAVIGVMSPWQPGVNFAAVLYDGTPYSVEVACGGRGDGVIEEIHGFDSSCYEQRELPLWRGTAYLGSLLAVAVGLSLARFRRRDV